MNSREKLLASIVAGLVVMLVAYFVWSSAAEAISQRQTQLTNARLALKRQNMILQQASRATRKLAELKKRSLPKSRERANSLYNEWLLDLVDRVGFREPSVRAADRRFRSSYFDRLRFELNAEATLDQLADFLAEFYAVGDLHKIISLTIEPIPDSRHLDLAISVEGIALPIAERNSVGDVLSEEVTTEMILSARTAILNRAVFFPSNIAPLLEGVADQRIVRGRDWRVEARAVDPDPWDGVEVEVKSELPEGMRVESRDDSAVLSWTPDENGEYTVRLVARDTGVPRRETVREFKLTVVDPPEASDEERQRVEGFDHATQTFLVATVSNQDGANRQAWFNVRTEGRMLKLGVGDELNVGSIVGKVTKVERRHVEIKTASDLYQIAIGKPLTDGVPVVARAP